MCSIVLQTIVCDIFYLYSYALLEFVNFSHPFNFYHFTTCIISLEFNLKAEFCLSQKDKDNLLDNAVNFNISNI